MNKGKLYLAGGGNAEQSYTADKEIFKNIQTILYIPLAWDDNDRTYQNCRDWFEKEICLIHNISSFDMIKNPNQNINLDKYNMVYIGGGNTFKLLKELKESELGNKIINYINNGGIVYGGSAGAIIFGKTIEPCMIGHAADKNLVRLKDLTGLNVVDYDIHCHYNEKTDFELISKYSKTNKRKVIAIPEENVVLILNGKINKVFGTKEIKIFE